MGLENSRNNIQGEKSLHKEQKNPKDLQQDQDQPAEGEGQINQGGKQFTGSSTDQQTTKTGVPSMSDNVTDEDSEV